MIFKKIIKELAFTVILAFLLSFFLQLFIIEARIIPTGSMLPTIQLNQRILVNKIIYKYSEPARGDIIVFSPPFETEDNKDYIKRVIGKEGDTIEVKKGVVFINNEPLDEDYLLEKPKYNFGPIIVPDNSLFVLGDNRNESFDSHAWTQWLTLDKVKGKAFFTYWPFTRLGLFNSEVTRAHINNK
ncbi:MAG: signal peptidase I [Bacillota bacterium]